MTGGGWHDFEAQKEILRQGIGARLQVEFTVDHEAGADPTAEPARFSDPAWAKPFDVVLYNMSLSREQKPETAQAIIDSHVAHGVAAVLLHGSLHSYRFTENPNWYRFIGVRSMRHEDMRALTHQALEPGHPVMAGVPDSWRQEQEELYVIEEMFPETLPLAQAHGEETGREHPTIWLNEYRGVRVFATTIGHHNETTASDAYLDLVARGLLWATGRLAE